jgi:putative PEP-CTERM system histidine kinase
MSMQMLVPTLAAVSSLALATAALAGRPRLRLQWLFALGMAAFAAEAMCAFMLLTIGDLDSHARPWLTAMLVVGLLSLLPWTFFVALLADLRVPLLPRAWRIGAAIVVALAGAAAVAVTLYPAFIIGAGGWDLTGARLSLTGRAAAIVELLLTVGILVGLESCLRTARGDNRRRVKYLVLGLGGIFLIRFYVLSQMLLFQGIVPLHLKVTCATLFVGNLLLAVPITRDQLRGVRITVSRQILYRSAMIGVLGVYLFAVAALGSLLTYLAIPEQTFWGSVVVFVSALALGAILLSDRLRWRLQRFITLNFYRSRYDYRQQWVAFTKRMSSLLTAEDIARELLDSVTETIGASTGAVYLSDTGDARYRLCGHVGGAAYAAVIDRASPLLTWLGAQDAPARPPAEIAASSLSAELPSVVATPLRWRANMIGLIVLGPERSGTDYTVDDLVFVSTVAEQAAGTMVTARLSEAMAQAREMETFDKVTATVVHDIKNSVSALAMLSRNALKNFDDPEFQRDTMTTLSRTVDRMRRLLTRLSSPVTEAPTTLAEPVDLSGLVLEATIPLMSDSRIRLVRDLGSVPKVAGDRDALLRVIENLVTNAAEAIDGEGTIAVALAEAGGRAVLTVSDTGCGISEDFMQRHLFSPMRSTKKGGWGIGLYHTKQIIEHHHGTITVDSVEGQGTTFGVTLPIWAEPEGPARQTERDANVWETVR